MALAEPVSSWDSQLNRQEERALVLWPDRSLLVQAVDSYKFYDTINFADPDLIDPEEASKKSQHKRPINSKSNLPKISCRCPEFAKEIQITSSIRAIVCAFSPHIKTIEKVEAEILKVAFGRPHKV